MVSQRQFDIGININVEQEELRKLNKGLELQKAKVSAINKRMDVFRKKMLTTTTTMGKAVIRAKMLEQSLALKGAKKAISTIKGRIKQTTVNVKQLNAELAKGGLARQAWDKSKQGVLGFNGALLSTMFFGMALKNVMGGALKSIFDGYKKIIPENHEFNRQTTRLSANWEFFKFQLADTFASSKVFTFLVDGAISLLNMFQKLPGPVKTLIVAMMGILFVVGAFMLFIGVVGLGIAGLTDLGAGLLVLKGIGAGVFTALGGYATTFWATVTGPIGIFIAAIAAAFYLGSLIINKWLVDEGMEIKGFWNNIMAVGTTFLAGFVNLVLIIGATIVGVFTTLYDTAKTVFGAIIDVAGSFGKAIWAAIKAGITGGLGAAKDAFLNTFDAKGLGERLQDGFVSGFTEGATAKLITKTGQMTKWVTDKNKEFIDSISTPIEEMDPAETASATAAKAASVTNIINLDGAPQAAVGGGMTEIMAGLNKELEAAGYSDYLGSNSGN